jgi:acyl carrier protein
MEFERVCKIIANQLDLDPSEITMESNLIEDLRADSLDIVELVMDMEQEFDIEIPDEDLPKVQTVGDIVRFLQK